MDNQSSESSDTVILVLGDHRLEANKNKLVSKSQYFACLFSENFRDYLETEFNIGYGISLEVLQGFVDWVNDETDTHPVDSAEFEFTVQKSLLKFLAGKSSDLFELLRLSVIFVTEKLTEQVTLMISLKCMRRPLDEVLDIWQLAEYNELEELRDVALSVCLDRINEIPIASLVDLSFEKFFTLVCNINANCAPEQLMDIRRAWIEGNSKPPNLDDSSLRFIEGRSEDVLQAIKEGIKSRCQQCIAGQEINGTQFVYSWDGNDFRKLLELPREIIAWRFLGKGFYIYVVGHKVSEITPYISTTIWRYCIFKKKWMVETTLPRHRQSTQAVLLENKLYLFGGTGDSGEPCPAMDVYDIHTGVWSEAKEPPVAEVFPQQPMGSTCAGHGKILYQRAFMLHVYDTLTDVWNAHNIKPPPNSKHLIWEKVYMFNVLRVYKQPNSKYLGVYVRYGGLGSCEYQRTLALFLIARSSCAFISRIHSWTLKIYQEHIFNGLQIVGIRSIDRRVTVEVGEVILSRTVDYGGTYQCLKIMSRDVLQDGSTLTDHGCFNLNKEDTLQTTITMPESVKIGDNNTLVETEEK